jgi:hypothetical protein
MGSNHGNRGVSRLYAKKCATFFYVDGDGFEKMHDGDGWLAGGVSPIKKSFFLFIFGFYLLTRKTSVLAGDLSARQH